MICTYLTQYIRIHIIIFIITFFIPIFHVNSLLYISKPGTHRFEVGQSGDPTIIVVDNTIVDVVDVVEQLVARVQSAFLFDNRLQFVLGIQFAGDVFQVELLREVKLFVTFDKLSSGVLESVD